MKMFFAFLLGIFSTVGFTSFLLPVALAQSAIGGNQIQPPTQKSPTLTITEIKNKYPELDGLDDNQVVDAVHQAFYADLPRAQIAEYFGIKPTVKSVIKKLGIWDQWRYNSCQENAAKAPTPVGVTTGLHLCRERFEQQR